MNEEGDSEEQEESDEEEDEQESAGQGDEWESPPSASQSRDANSFEMGQSRLKPAQTVKGLHSAVDQIAVAAKAEGEGDHNNEPPHPASTTEGASMRLRSELAAIATDQSSRVASLSAKAAALSSLVFEASEVVVKPIFLNPSIERIEQGDDFEARALPFRSYSAVELLAMDVAKLEAFLSGLQACAIRAHQCLFPVLPLVRRPGG